MADDTRTHLALNDALDAVRTSADGLYAILLEQCGIELGFYRPGDEDRQQPHDRDEVYVVARGSGRFECEDESKSFTQGDALYVPAGRTHRFVDYSEDFATWVFFWQGQPD